MKKIILLILVGAAFMSFTPKILNWIYATYGEGSEVICFITVVAVIGIIYGIEHFKTKKQKKAP